MASVGAALIVALVLGGFAIRTATAPDSDRASSTVEHSAETEPPVPSNSAVVTLNPRTGQILAGTVVILDPNTGKILALRASPLADLLENTPPK